MDPATGHARAPQRQEPAPPSRIHQGHEDHDLGNYLSPALGNYVSAHSERAWRRGVVQLRSCGGAFGLGCVDRLDEGRGVDAGADGVLVAAQLGLGVRESLACRARFGAWPVLGVDQHRDGLVDLVGVKRLNSSPSQLLTAFLMGPRVGIPRADGLPVLVIRVPGFGLGSGSTCRVPVGCLPFSGCTPRIGSGRGTGRSAWSAVRPARSCGRWPVRRLPWLGAVAGLG